MLDPKYKNAIPVHNSLSRITYMAHKKARKCNSAFCLQCAEMEKPKYFTNITNDYQNIYDPKIYIYIYDPIPLLF